MIPFARISKYGNIAPDLKNIKKMAIMNNNTLFILYQNGDLYARGSDASVYPDGVSSPGAFKLIRSNVQRLYCGYGDKCALAITEDGTWWHIGRQSLYTASSSGTQNTVWTDVTPNFTHFTLDTIADITLTSTGMVYLLTDGKVYTRGYNTYGEIYSTTSTPQYVYADGAKIFSCSNVTCVVLKDGSLYCGGYNGGGQLGRSTGASSSGPLGASTMTNIRDVVTNGAATYAVNYSNVAYACGSTFLNTNGSSGQWTGIGNATGDLVQSGACGDNIFASANPQSGLYSAGRNDNNTLGTGDLVTHSQFGRYSSGLPLTNVEWVSSSSNNCVFVVVDSKLYATGTGSSALSVFNINSTSFTEIQLP